MSGDKIWRVTIFANRGANHSVTVFVEGDEEAKGVMLTVMKAIEYDTVVTFKGLNGNFILHGRDYAGATAEDVAEAGRLQNRLREAFGHPDPFGFSTVMPEPERVQ